MMGAAWLVPFFILDEPRHQGRAVFLAKGSPVLCLYVLIPATLSSGDFFAWMNGQGANH